MPSRKPALGDLTDAGSLDGSAVPHDSTGNASSPPPVVENRPDAVYYPTHVDRMRMADLQRAGGYGCALGYSYPQRFWLVTDAHRSKVTVKPPATVHAMVVVWHLETGRVITDVNPKLRISKGETSVISDAPWPMLNQPMGFHFGDNLRLPGDGTYDLSVHVGSPAAERAGRLAGAPERLSFDLAFDYSREARDEIRTRRLSDKAGERGAVPTMKSKHVPRSSVPKRDAFPGRVLGSGTSGDAEFVVSVLDDATRFGGHESQAYLAVSPRTPHDRYPLPLQSLSATVGDVTYGLAETLDCELGLHYGRVVDCEPDVATVHVDAPVQAARHEGYETAFLVTSDVTVTA